MANIAAYDMSVSDRIKASSIYTYGGPRVGGKTWVSAFIQKFGKRSQQWVHGADPVARVPFGFFKSLKNGKLTYLKPRERYQPLPRRGLSGGSKIGKVISILNPLDGKGLMADHFVKEGYATKLWRHIKKWKNAYNVPNIMGDIYLGCAYHDTCKASQYCSTTGKNRCKPKKKTGKGCLSKDVCASGICIRGQCNDCRSSEDCKRGQYCGKAGVNECKALKPKGKRCLTKAECKSGKCSLLKKCK